MWDLSLLLRDIDGLCAQASAEIREARTPQLETDKMFKTQDSRYIRAKSSERSATYAETMVVPFPFLEARSAIDKAFISMISSECIPAISEVAADASTVTYKHVWSQFEVLSICRTIGDRTHSDLAWQSIIRERGRPSAPYITERGWGRVVPTDGLDLSTRVQFVSLWKAERPQSLDPVHAVPVVEPLDRYAQIVVKLLETYTLKLAHTLEDVVIDKSVTRKQEFIDECEV